MPLCTLPNELLYNITNNLNQKDVLNLLKVDRFTVLVISPILHNFAMIDKAGLPALCWAIQKGYIPLVRILLRKGVDINARFSKSPKTPVQNAAVVVEEAKKVEQWPYGETPLHIAIFFKRRPIVNILCKNGANLEILDHCHRMTALQKAAHYGASEVLGLLIQYNAIINAQQANGKTALHEAAGYGDTKSVRMLVNWKYFQVNEALDMSVHVRDRNGATALHWAAKGGDLTVIRLLVTAGSFIDAQDIAGDTPLIKSAARNWEYRRTGIAAVRLLLKKGANPSLKNAKGYTALYFAKLGKKESMITLLEEYIKGRGGYKTGGNRGGYKKGKGEKAKE